MIKLYNLITGYNTNKIGVSITGCIKPGSMIAIVGPNGIGKSTLLKTLAGLLPPISGSLELSNKTNPLSISYLPQKITIDLNFPLTVFDVVSMGCWPGICLIKKLDKKQLAIIWRSLKQVKLLNTLNQYISNLSGGQVQRMLFARVLVQKSSLILLDEPFQGVDLDTCNMMISAIKKLCKFGHTAIVVSHDIKFINKHFSDIFLLTSSCRTCELSM
ncbi:metal ABC transporter ATP-binding protein [Candidatus Blochmannia ocreatus (nom. nud.)]|uniref:ABC transporter ATP-binding protein n=1 Tax=Candidatus Blochmannia ocreatus (nom. nud.) TaxID=251538 RepID=A0ABY4ST19_9ENTR|nr:ABC transporter ATP-binding protein [Candidatus Blochmannia ocreatus]URJ25131.1 ABC transporter ATP-binding protein [Candidatus Blochmannia ocreatus]